jgi:hypothetical protein
MEQRPSWEAKRSSASQEIPRILQNPKVHHCIYKHSPPVLILSNSYYKGKCNVVPAYAVKAYVKLEVCLHSFLVDRGYCSTSRPGRFTPE